MATNLNITANSTSVSSNNFSITVTDNNTGNVVNISPPTSPIVSISAAGILGNPGKDSDVIAGESVIFQHITASGEISASGIVYGSQINIDGGIFTSASLAAAEASGDNLGNHTATQNLNLDGNSLLDGLNITASGGIRANNVDVGDVSGMSSIYDLRVGGGGIRTSGTGYFYGISNPSSYTGAGRITLSDPDAYIQTPSYVSASRAILTQITASGNISSSGDLSITGESFFGSHITTSGDISSSKSIIANTLTVDSISSSNIVLPESSNSTLTLFSDQTNKAAFLLNGRSNMDSYLSVLSGQKLGIGLAVDETPSSKLTINGDLKVSSHITASGNISSSGNIIGEELKSDGRIYSNNRVGVYNTDSTNFLAVSTHPTEIDGTNIKLNAPVTASGNISASGLVYGSQGRFPARIMTDNIYPFTSGQDITIADSINVVGNITASGEVLLSENILFSGTKTIKRTNNGSILTFGPSNMILSAGGVQNISLSNTSININEAGANLDFRVESSNDTHSFFIDASEDKIGIGTSTPPEKLTVEGNISGSGNLKIDGSQVDFTNLPTSDPSVAGRLWNDSGTLKISAG